MSDHDEAADEAHVPALVDDLHGGGPAAAAPDEHDAGDHLAAMPSLLETVTPAQMAMTIHTHLKELYAMTYDRDANRFKGDPNNLLRIACGMLLIAFDDRTLSIAMAHAADENKLFNTFDAARDYSIQGRS